MTAMKINLMDRFPDHAVAIFAVYRTKAGFGVLHDVREDINCLTDILSVLQLRIDMLMSKNTAGRKKETLNSRLLREKRVDVNRGPE